MVIRFTIQEAEEFQKLNKQLSELESFVSDEAYYKIAHDVLNLNVLKNVTLLNTLADFIKNDMLKTINAIKEKIEVLGKDYKN